MPWSWLQVLSANAESSINIECLMDDVDVSSELNREQLEEMVAPFLGRLQAVLRSALESSGETHGAVEREQARASSCLHLAGLACGCLHGSHSWTCCGPFSTACTIFYNAQIDSSSSILPILAPAVLRAYVHRQ
jgi:hypothetical protein